MGLGVRASLQLRRLDALLEQPLVVVPAAHVGVVDHEVDLGQAVVVARDRDALAPVALQVLPFVPARGPRLAHCVAWQRVAQEGVARGAHDAHVLQVALADLGGLPAALEQRPHEGVCAPVQRDAVGASPVHRRHAAGRDAGAVRHADRVRHDRAVEAHPGRGDTVQVRRAQHRVSAEAGVIGPVLVGDDEQEVRALGHAAHLTRVYRRA